MGLYQSTSGPILRRAWPARGMVVDATEPDERGEAFGFYGSFQIAGFVIGPAIGGIGKGHLTREIDALGGAMAGVIDEAGIQFRTLNASKGPAVRATRAQADRALYRAAVRAILEEQPGLRVFQQEVIDLDIDASGVCGVVTRMGLRFAARAVVLTVGTFLGGRIHIGLSNYAGGRAGDRGRRTHSRPIGRHSGFSGDATS